MSYSSYDHDNLEPASTMRIERRIYFESGKADLSEMVKLPLAELLSLRAESAAAEQEAAGAGVLRPAGKAAYRLRSGQSEPEQHVGKEHQGVHPGGALQRAHDHQPVLRIPGQP